MTARARELRYEAVIEAPPERVWETLVGMTAWDHWNPTLFKCSGELAPGNEVTMKLRLGRITIHMSQQIMDVTPPRRLAWRTRQIVSARALDVVRWFEIEPTGDGRSRFVQGEAATGFMARPVMKLLGKGIVKGYANLARELANQVKVRAV